MRDFFGSDVWPFYRYNANRRRRFDLVLKDVEPGAKKSMPSTSKTAVRQAVCKQLAAQKRGPFRGPVALRLIFETTAKTPPHIQSIAKNFLDVLGRSTSHSSSRAGAVLYHDDSQVHALSVSCRHGQTQPFVRITAQSHRSFVQDLGIAAYVGERFRERRHRESFRSDLLEDAVEDFMELVRDGDDWRNTYGEEVFQQRLSLAQRDAQESIFTKTKIGVPFLASLHGSQLPIFLRGYKLPRLSARSFETLLRSFPLRVSLPDLPRKQNQSKAYMQVVREALRGFRDEYSMVLTPLRIPAALEVFVKPPQEATLNTIHDVDNIVRNYLIPAILDELKPLSSFEFSFDDRKMAHRVRAEDEMLERRAPESTRHGVPRYEVWKLPRFDGDPPEGFVCLNFVYDLTGFGDCYSRIENELDEARMSMR